MEEAAVQTPSIRDARYRPLHTLSQLQARRGGRPPAQPKTPKLQVKRLVPISGGYRFHLVYGCLTVTCCYYFPHNGSIVLGAVGTPRGMIRTSFMPGAQINAVRKALDTSLRTLATPNTAQTSPQEETRAL